MKSASYITSWVPVAIIAIAMAACSLIYELTLAQSLTALFGGNIIRYSVTIGLYLFGLGLGALYTDLRTAPNPALAFFQTQIILSILGSLGVLGLFILSVWQYELPMLIFLYAHGLILTIGFFSGREIPQLTMLCEGRFADVLQYDYWGALIGSVAFALWLYPILGLVNTTLCAAIINWGLCLYITRMMDLAYSLKILLWGTGLFLLIAVLFEKSLRTFLQQLYLSGELNVF